MTIKTEIVESTYSKPKILISFENGEKKYKIITNKKTLQEINKLISGLDYVSFGKRIEDKIKKVMQ